MHNNSTEYFSHSGDIGDIIYGLPTIRAAGGGKLYFFSQINKTTHLMTRDRTELIKPLLVLQPYIHDIDFIEHDVKDHNINGFRSHARFGRNLADMHLSTHGFNFCERNTKWIDVDHKNMVSEVIVHRSDRYNNDSFPWKAIIDKYKDKITMIGIYSEYEKFCDKYGTIKYYKTKDYLEIARVIAGSKLFIGNQSSPLAVAEAMKINLICEVCPYISNCCFERVGRINGWDNRIELPII